MQNTEKYNHEWNPRFLPTLLLSSTLPLIDVDLQLIIFLSDPISA